MAEIRILALGDIVQHSGTAFVREHLWKTRKEKNIDFVIANAENSGKNSAIDKNSAETLFEGGCDVLTTGNHVFRNRDFYSYLDECERVLRPANYPSACPGLPYGIYDVCGYRMLVINVMGTAFIESLDSPFLTAERILEREDGNFDFAVIDFHAEATSEKTALAMNFDSRVSVVFGTHTHIQTNDARVLKGGTGYITDVGMTGVFDSVLGLDPKCMIDKFKTRMPQYHVLAEGEIVMSGAIFTIDTKDFKCKSVEAINEK